MAETVLGEITDWIYSQIVGFLGNFFGEMGSMGAELFQMSWVQSIVLFLAESQGSATQEEKTSEGESQLRHFLGRLLMRCSMR